MTDKFDSWDYFFWLAIACAYLGSMIGTTLYYANYFGVTVEAVVEAVRFGLLLGFLFFNAVGLYVVPALFWGCYNTWRNVKW